MNSRQEELIAIEAESAELARSCKLDESIQKGGNEVKIAFGAVIVNKRQPNKDTDK